MCEAIHDRGGDGQVIYKVSACSDTPRLECAGLPRKGDGLGREIGDHQDPRPRSGPERIGSERSRGAFNASNLPLMGTAECSESLAGGWSGNVGELCFRQEPDAWVLANLNFLLAVQPRGIRGTHNQELLSGRESIAGPWIAGLSDAAVVGIEGQSGSSCRTRCSPWVLGLESAFPGPRIAIGACEKPLCADVVELGTRLALLVSCVCCTKWEQTEAEHDGQKGEYGETLRCVRPFWQV